MNREDYISIAIRVFGLYLLVLAGFACVQAVWYGAVLVSTRPWESLHSWDWGFSPASWTGFLLSGGPFVKVAVQLALFTWAGIHLVCGGKRITDLILEGRDSD